MNQCAYFKCEGPKTQWFLFSLSRWKELLEPKLLLSWDLATAKAVWFTSNHSLTCFSWGALSSWKKSPLSWWKYLVCGWSLRTCFDWFACSFLFKEVDSIHSHALQNTPHCLGLAWDEQLKCWLTMPKIFLGVDYLNALTHAQYIQILVNVVSMPICRHRCLHVFMADPNCFHEAAHLIFSGTLVAVSLQMFTFWIL